MAIVFEKKPNQYLIENKDLINPLIELRTDICPKCKAQRIELFSFNNYPQNYKDAVDAHLMGYNVEFNRYEIRYMKCRSCNSEFVMDWSYGLPVPLRDTYKTSRFLNEFIMGI